MNVPNQLPDSSKRFAIFIPIRIKTEKESVSKCFSVIIGLTSSKDDLMTEMKEHSKQS